MKLLSCVLKCSVFNMRWCVVCESKNNRHKHHLHLFGFSIKMIETKTSKCFYDVKLQSTDANIMQFQKFNYFCVFFFLFHLLYYNTMLTYNILSATKIDERVLLNRYHRYMS